MRRRSAGQRSVRRSGLAAVEAITVTALLGVLAASVLPRLADVQALAEEATLRGLGAAAASAMHANYGGCLVTGQQPREGRCVAVADCAALPALWVGGVPAGYAVAARPLGAPGSQAECTLRRERDGAEVVFVGIATAR